MSPGGIGSGPQIMLALPDRGDERPLCACLSFYYGLFTSLIAGCVCRYNETSIDLISVVSLHNADSRLTKYLWAVNSL